MLQKKMKAAATISGWDWPLLTFIYPGFGCGTYDFVCGLNRKMRDPQSKPKMMIIITKYSGRNGDVLLKRIPFRGQPRQESTDCRPNLRALNPLNKDEPRTLPNHGSSPLLRCVDHVLGKKDHLLLKKNDSVIGTKLTPEDANAKGK